MKTKLLLTFIFLILIFSANAQGPWNPLFYPYVDNTPVEPYDSIYYWKADNTFIWKLNCKSINRIYDVNKNLLEETIQVLREEKWENAEKITHTYDHNNNETSSLSQRCWTSDGVWKNNTLTTNVYVNNKLTESILEQWVVTVDEWMIQRKELFTYDNLGNKLTSEYHINNWGLKPTDRYFYTYDSKGLLFKTELERYTAPSWVPNRYYLNTYDVNNNLLYQVGYSPDNSLWDSLRNVYQSNKLISSEHFYWEKTVNQWSKSFMEKYTYDSNNNLIYHIYYFVQDGKPDAFESSSHYYNTLQQLTDKAHFTYAGNQKQQVDSTHYFIREVVNDPTDDNVVSIYPNPSNGIFTIKLGNKRPIQNLEVYNVVGELILQQQGGNQVSIPNPQAGVYFVKIDDGTEVYTKKLMIQ